jgi:hypothetical protein
MHLFLSNLLDLGNLQLWDNRIMSPSLDSYNHLTITYLGIEIVRQTGSSIEFTGMHVAIFFSQTVGSRQ